MIEFELPHNNENIIKVIGVGGGGGNAVNHMYNLGIDDVDFILCNTDMKALSQSPVPTKIQLGPNLTQGLGAGAKPEVGREASEESIEEIKKTFGENTQMVFVTAGMGGGTGTGAAPIVAKLAKDMGLLTVGIVTTPFSYEGRKRKLYAEEGIKALQENVDTLLVISNDKVRQHFGNVAISEAFAKADDILATAAKCITDVISSKGHIVVDFADVCTVMRDGGSAILGSANASGENRAAEAVQEALSSPLLNDRDIKGAQWILLNVNSSKGKHEHTLDEMEMIQAYVQDQAGEDCDLILGMGYDEELGEEISITVIATGFKTNDIKTTFTNTHQEKNKVVMALDEENEPKKLEAPTTENPWATSKSILHGHTKNESFTEKHDLTPRSFTLGEVSAPMMHAMSHGYGKVRTEQTLEREVMVLSEEDIMDDVESYEPSLEEMTAVPTKNEEREPTHSVAKTTIESSKETTEEKATEANPKNAADEIDAAFNTTEIRMVEKSEEQMAAQKDDEIIFEITNAFKEDEAPKKEVPTEDEKVTDEKTTSESSIKTPESEFVTINGITLNRKKGSRMLTDYELEQEANFELQKRAFDERASRLRNLSFNVNQPEKQQEDEEIPSYQRNNINLDDHPNSEDEHISGTKVSDKKNSMNSNISTLNNFLNGDYPD